MRTNLLALAAIVFCPALVLAAGTVSTTPNPPVAGQAVTVQYTTTGGPLTAASAIFIHKGYNNWITVDSPDAAMTRVGTSANWTITYTIPLGTTEIDMVFRDANNVYDNNTGTDWKIAVTTNGPSPTPSPTPATRAVIAPAPPVRGQSATITYTAAGGPLASAATVKIHLGYNAWATVEPTDATMTVAGAGIFQHTFLVPLTATEVDFAFNDGAASATWDNNGGLDWKIATVSGPTPTPSATPTASLTPTPSPTASATPAPGAPTVLIRQPAAGATIAPAATFTVDAVGFDNGTVTKMEFFVDGSKVGEDSSAVAPRPAAQQAAVTVGGSSPSLNAFGSRKTITIDGANTGGEWTSNEIVATDAAFDNANVVGGNWSTHETQFDYTALYAAWDNNNLYIGIQLADVIDVEDPANAGSSQGTPPRAQNLPMFVAIDSKPGGYGTDPTNGDMWKKSHGFTGANLPDYQVYFATNFWQGPYVCEYKNGAWNADADAIGPQAPYNNQAGYKTTVAGLGGKAGAGNAGAPIIGPGGKNYLTSTSHNTARDSFLELSIPLSTIGNPNLDSGSISIFVSHGEGTSGVDSIPNDPATTNTGGVSASNSPNEWLDFDNYTVAFAKVGLGAASTPTPSPTPTVSPTPSISPTATPTGGSAFSIVLNAVSFATGSHTLEARATDDSLLTGSAFVSFTIASPTPSPSPTPSASPTLPPSRCVVSPNPPVRGSTVLVTYYQAGGPLASASTIKAHIGNNAWATVEPTDPTMTSLGGGVFQYSYLVPLTATQIDFAFNDGAPTATWDNNGGADWHFTTSATTPTPSVTPTISLTPTISPTPSISPTASQIPTTSPTATPSLTASPTPTSTPRVITIGAGPTIGSTSGRTYSQEFQDWKLSDVRGLDADSDTATLGDGGDNARDILAAYLFDDPANNTVYFRVDLLDLYFQAENSVLDVYVVMDLDGNGLGNGGWPDSLGGNANIIWDLAVGVYSPLFWNVYTAPGNIISSNTSNPQFFRGAYFHGDLDSIEFGLDRSLLTGAGWDGSRAIRFQVATAKDMTAGVRDALPDSGQGSLSSQGSVTTAKYAFILHGNQAISSAEAIQDLIYNTTVKTPNNNPTGYHRALETASIFKVPANIHVSATKVSSALWADRPGTTDPQDGPEFINRIKNMIRDSGSQIVWGVYSEHIMPFFEGQVNQESIRLNDEYLRTVFDLPAPNANSTFWIPERVVRGATFADLTARGYGWTVLDQINHLRNWFGENGQGYKIHRINGVNCFMINDLEDRFKFANTDGGLWFETRKHLIRMARASDTQQLTLVFDDWEAYAGRSFLSFNTGSDNPDNFNTNIRWIANHPWIEVVKLEDIAARGWTPVDHGTNNNLSFQTYDFLHFATQQSYEHWYQGFNGTATEEAFDDTFPFIRADSNQRGTKKFGALASYNPTAGSVTKGAGTIAEDQWINVVTPGENPLKELARLSYVTSIFETAWHDETDGNRCDDGTYNCRTDQGTDNISGFARQLQFLNTRRGGMISAAAAWAASGVISATNAQSIDIDHDGELEYVLSNDRVFAVFENDGGRLITAFARDRATGKSVSLIGNIIGFPDQEDEREANTSAGALRTSGLSDWWAEGAATNMYVNDVMTATSVTNGWRFTSSDGRVVKTITLDPAASKLVVSYTLNAALTRLYVRNGLAPDLATLLTRGQAGVSLVDTGTKLTMTNTNSGASVAIDYAGAGFNATYNAAASDGTRNSPRNAPLQHVAELSGTGTFAFAIELSAGAATPTPTSTATPSLTPSPSPSRTATPSPTPSVTPTGTAAPTPSPTSGPIPYHIWFIR